MSATEQYERATVAQGPTDFVRRMQAMEVTPLVQGEPWVKFLARVEQTKTYLETGKVPE